VTNNLFIGIEDIEEPAWFQAVEPFVEKVLEKRNHSNWELSILFCSDTLIQQYNNDFRQIDSPTDVLSFEQGDEYIDDEGHKWFTAGDIAISIESLMKNVAEFGVTPNEELKRLLIHGILHLEGMDHGDAHITRDSHITSDTTGKDTGDEMLAIQEALLIEMKEEKIIKDEA
jgi:probable rRNA maturation factor